IPVEGPGNPWVIVSLIVHIALFVFAVIKLKKRHFLSYAILFYLIAISMYSNIRPAVGIVAERYAFTASFGFCMIIAWLIWRISLKGKETTGVPVVKTHRLLVLFALFVIPYSAKTISRNSDRYDHETLLSHDIQYMENSAKGNSIYADKLMNDITWNIEQTGNLQQNIPKIKRAEQLYRQSVKIYPQFAPSLNSLGFIRYAFYGHYDRALPYFRNAISADPEYFEAYFNLGLCYEKLMKTDSAIFFYNRAIEYDPAHMRGKKFLANLYLSMNDTSHAFILYRDITASDNTTQEPFVIMAQYYLATGDTIHAMKLMEEVYKRTPGDKNLAQGLAEWFRRAGNMEKAEFYDQCSRK
ncbi:MAG: tetratricopeptide repeat protein, partial [Bacteroidota bacterium]